jgi:hypothetical protein
MVFFDKEAQALRARWKAIDVKSVNFAESPFGITEDGLQDFRGYTVRGTLGEEYIISKKRFEKCDLSFSQFVHCKIIDSWFVSSKLYAVDFHSCQVISCPMPNCISELVVGYQKQQPSSAHIEQHIRSIVGDLAADLMRLRTLERLELVDFDRSVIFYLSMQSVPSIEALAILAQFLAQSDNPAPLVVLNQQELAVCSNSEKQLLKLLFGCLPCGLGEVAWVNDRTVLQSDILAKVPIRETIAMRLKLLQVRGEKCSNEMGEEEFWEIVDKANPSEIPYSPKAHAQRLLGVISTLSNKQLEQFEKFKASLLAQIYTFEMATAASTIGTGCSDSSFSDFSAALVYRGREVFYEVLANAEEALLKLNGAHYLLLEGFGYLTDNETSKRFALDQVVDIAKQVCLCPRVGFGGVPIDDEEKAFRKCFPKLFKKYWNKEEFQLNYALSLDCDSVAD